jgi:hypothetical protein
MRFAHRERINVIKSSSSGSPSDFLLGTITVSPTNFALSQILPNIAANFIYARFLGIRFTFQSLSSDALNSTNTSLGQICYRWIEDPTVPTDSSLSTMLSSASAVVSRPSSSWSFVVPVQKRWLKVNLNGRVVPTGEDPRVYQEGVFELATEGFQANAVTLGQLWVTYYVELKSPQIFSGMPARFCLSYQNGRDGVGIGNVLGTNSVSKQDPHGLVDTASSQLITFNRICNMNGIVKVHVCWTGTAAGDLTMNATPVTVVNGELLTTAIMDAVGSTYNKTFHISNCNGAAGETTGALTFYVRLFDVHSFAPADRTQLTFVAFTALTLPNVRAQIFVDFVNPKSIQDGTTYTV